MSQIQLVQGGEFISVAGETVERALFGTKRPDAISLQANILGTDATANVAWNWFKNDLDGTATGIQQTITTLALTGTALAEGGISIVDPAIRISNSKAITSVSTTFLTSMTDTTGFAVGDSVFFTNITDGAQLSGIIFQITALVEDTSLTLGYALTSGLVLDSATGAGTISVISKNHYYPKRATIANITNANQAKIYFTKPHDYVEGAVISLRIGALFGLGEINMEQGKVLSIVNSGVESSAILDINTSGLGTFTWPSSADALLFGTTPAHSVPVGGKAIPLSEVPLVAMFAFENRREIMVRFGGALFDVSDVRWAWKATVYQPGG